MRSPEVPQTICSQFTQNGSINGEKSHLFLERAPACLNRSRCDIQTYKNTSSSKRSIYSTTCFQISWITKLATTCTLVNKTNSRRKEMCIKWMHSYIQFYFIKKYVNTLTATKLKSTSRTKSINKQIHEQQQTRIQ